MPKQIYNEGRVVGYSAYEIYVKHALISDPEHLPMSEQEWLTSMLCSQSAMLLKVGIDDEDGMHYRDFDFPTNCSVCAANTITASYFEGQGYVSGSVNLSGWCTKVINYGPLITQQTSATNPGELGPDDDVPPPNSSIADYRQSDTILNYLKIVDGVIIQPGTWSHNPNGNPSKDFTPNLSERPRLRILFNGRITTPFYVLFTGFTDRSTIANMSNINSAVNTLSPQNGDFLGPGAFPWANKVIFSIPTCFLSSSNHVMKQISDILQSELSDADTTKHYHITVGPQGVGITRISDVLIQFLEEINTNFTKLDGTQNDFLIRMDGNGVTLKAHV